MDKNKVDLYLMTRSKYFENHQLEFIRDRLLKMDEDRWYRVQTLQLKDPVLMLVISLIGGHFGIDRFVIGDVGLGIAKLLTCGGLGIWTVVDWFLIMERTREKNLEHFHMMTM
ncbi:MAG: TM2 domain-containing protein [Bacteroidales bacterium]